MGTMLDTSHKSLRDFNIYDTRGRLVKEPTVPMLIEELEKVRALLDPLDARSCPLIEPVPCDRAF